MTHRLELIRPTAPLSYAEGLQLQDQVFERIVAARAARAATGVCVNSTARPEPASYAGGVILLEHTPTITLGKEALPGDLLADEAFLATQGIAVAKTDRGGEVTVHAPGQWVLYPVLDMHVFGKDVTGHIRKLEEVAIRTAARFAIAAGRIPGVSGAWLPAQPAQTAQPGQPAQPARPEAKLCAVGISVRKWITRHGLCFNVAAQMPVYQYIVPCGQHSRGVTNLATLTGRTKPENAAVLMAEAAAALLAEFSAVFDATF